ncbi:MAG: class I adenylate-forming enzyme family protein [Hyphomicrobiales bacterium]|nr:class I adenylate-forming enzyme family protein [Hyphomicrobiales bacterium]
MFDIPSVFLPDIISGHARRWPEKRALVCDDATMTWRELDIAICAFARFLRSRGVGRGARVAVLAEPTAGAIVAQFGALRAGAGVASLSGMVSGDSLARMIRDSGAETLIVDGHFSPVIASIADQLPADMHHTRIAIGDVRGGWTAFADALAEGVAQSDAPFPRLEPDDDFVILYSSGTTGIPKGIVLSHGCRLSNCWLLAVEKRYDADAIVFSATALYSNTTWTLLTLAFFVGGTAVAMRKFEAVPALALLQRWRVTHTILVPAVLRMILDCEGADRADLGTIRALCTTGSQMPRLLKERVIARFPCAYFEIYGLTEGLILILRPDEVLAYIDSVGKPMIGNDIRIIDDAGRVLPAGEKGEIVGYGPLLMRGYNRRPDATEEAIWREPETRKTFLRSGDIGYFDRDGFLHLVDRKKDMLVSGGYNVYPADIERVILQHPAVLEATVIGVPHDKWGETPLAYVVQRPGAPVIEAADLAGWINARVGKHERVWQVRFLASLPRNAGGKILKRELRDSFGATIPAKD